MLSNISSSTHNPSLTSPKVRPPNNPQRYPSSLPLGSNPLPLAPRRNPPIPLSPPLRRNQAPRPRAQPPIPSHHPLRPPLLGPPPRRPPKFPSNPVSLPRRDPPLQQRRRNRRLRHPQRSPLLWPDNPRRHHPPRRRPLQHYPLTIPR